MDFLPENYESAVKQKSYWKMSEMQPGDNRFRIVQRPIAGWLDWKDARPHRFPPNQKPLKPFDPTKEIKAFWSCYVWDYIRKDLFVLEITQATVIKSLIHLAKDEEWGDFTLYDLKLKKEGSGQQTKYMLSPLPPKPLSDEIKLALKAKPVILEALYHGGDPWDWAAQPGQKSTVVEPSSLSMPAAPRIDPKPNKEAPDLFSLKQPIEELKESLELENIQTSRLEEWISLRAQTKGETRDNVIKACLEKATFAGFKKAFSSWLAAPKAALAS